MEELLSEVDTESVLEALGDAATCTAAKEELATAKKDRKPLKICFACRRNRKVVPKPRYPVKPVDPVKPEEVPAMEELLSEVDTESVLEARVKSEACTAAIEEYK